MLYNDLAIIKLIKEICYTIELEPTESYYRSKLLDFFRFLIYCNGKSLKFNQIQILKVMQDDSYSSIILKPTSEMIEELVTEYLIDNREHTGSLVKMSSKLTYLVSFFQIMESLIDDNNSVNMGKVIKKFPF